LFQNSDTLRLSVGLAPQTHACDAPRFRMI
jgi:hypothetical protein